MPGGLGLRFALEVAFLIAVAAAAALLDLGWIAIVAVMGVAWLATTAVEWRLSRARRAPAPEPRPVVLPPLADPAEGILAVRPLAPDVEGPDVETAGIDEPPPAPPPAPPGHVRILPRERAPAPEPEPVTAELESEPALEPEPEVAAAPEPEPALLSAVPEPEPSPPEPPPPAPEPERVLAFPAAPAVPRRWNLWELERVARALAGDDPAQSEELGFLLVYLRDFSDADGSLPEEFDALVRESFGDLATAGV